MVPASDLSASADSRNAFKAQGWWRDDDTLPTWVKRWARAIPNSPAIYTDGATVTYGALWQRAHAAARGLRAAGLLPGDVMAVQLPNSVEFVVMEVAAGLCGAVMQTVHMPYRAAELEMLLGHSRAKIAVVQAATRDHPAPQILEGLRGKLPALETVIVIGDDGPEYFTAITSESDDEPWSPVSAVDPFVLLYTSGTTDSPKGVLASGQNFLGNSRLIANELQISQSSILLTAAPFTHLYGLLSINVALAVGASVALLSAFTPDALIGALRKFKPTGLFCAPAHLSRCRAAGLLTPAALTGLDFTMISGSVCPPELAAEVQELLDADGKVLQLWGMSELQAGTFTRPGDDLSARLRTVGRACPGTELRVIGENGTPVIGQGGHLQIRGPSVFAGYLRNPAATAAAFDGDGWFMTGDLAMMDDAGNVRIVGRLKELINRGGVKFNPVDIEALLDGHPSIQQSAIVPMPDPLLGERACCFAALKVGKALTLDDVRAWLESHGVTKVKWPERLEIVDALPLTPTRKVMKGELIKLAAALRQ